MLKRHQMIAFREIISLLLIMLILGTFPPISTQAQSNWHEVALLGRGTVNQMALSPDGKVLATGGSLGIWLYDLESMEPISLLQGHTHQVLSIAFSSDGKKLASVGSYRDRTLRVWDVQSGAEILNINAGEQRNFSRVVFSPDGKLLATTSTDGMMQIWDAATGDEIVVLTGLEWLIEIAFSPDGSLLVFVELRQNPNTYDYTGYLHVWDIASQSEVTSIEAHTDIINQIAFSPDGKTVATTSQDGRLLLWDSETWQALDPTIDAPFYGLPLAFSPDGQWLASATYNPPGSNLGSTSWIYLWNTSRLNEFIYFGEHPTHVVDIVFTPDSKTLISVSEEGILKFWDVETQTELATIDQAVSGTLSAAFSPDGQTFATASDYEIVRLWDTETVTEIKTFNGESIGYGEFRPMRSSVMFSPDGSLLVTSSIGVRLWEVETGILRGEYGHGWLWVTSPTGFAEDGQSLAVTDYLAMSGITYTSSLDVQTLRPIEGLSVSDQPNNNDLAWMAISDDGRFDAFTFPGYIGGSNDGVTGTSIDISEYSSTYGDRVVAAVLFIPNGGDIEQMLFSHDARLFAAVDAQHTIHLWETESFSVYEGVSEIATFSGHTSSVNRLIFSENGQWLASKDAGGTIRIWDISDGSEIATVTNPNPEIWGIVLSPTWQTLAVSDSEGTIRLWDMNTQSEMATFSGNNLSRMVFSPDEQTFVYGDSDSTLHLWDMTTHTEIAALNGHVGGIRSIVFSPDGQTLLSVGEDSTIRVWRQGE